MNSGSSGDAVRNWNGTVNMTSGTIDGGDGSESNGLYNKGEANISGGVITAESLSTFITGSTVYNEDGTLTVSGNATVSNTGTGYALQAARNSSEVITVTNITGGSITASNNAAVYISDIPLTGYEGENSVYLSGAPRLQAEGATRIYTWSPSSAKSIRNSTPKARTTLHIAAARWSWISMEEAAAPV